MPVDYIHSQHSRRLKLAEEFKNKYGWGLGGGQPSSEAFFILPLAGRENFLSLAVSGI